jgi:RimJ/RimL family protein N-acetyltransferase
MGTEVQEITALARDRLEQSMVSRADAELTDSIRECETAMRVLIAMQLQMIAEADRRGVFTAEGARNAKTWLQSALRISGGEAEGRVKVARKVAHRNSPTGEALPAELPATAEALREGAIGLDHARGIAEGMRKIAPLVSDQQCDEAEATLAEHARTLGPHEVRTLAERLRYHHDQDGALKDEQRQIEDRELHIGVGRDGMTVLKGWLDKETGAKLQAALEPLAAPQPEKNSEKDPRSPAKRNADAFATLLDLVLSTDDLPRAGGQRPHLNITIDFDALRNQVTARSTPGGTLENTGQPITAAQVRRITCDCEVLPIVLGSRGQPLDVGRTQRTAPPHMRAALLARDGKCSFPGCDHPPGNVGSAPRAKLDRWRANESEQSRDALRPAPSDRTQPKLGDRPYQRTSDVQPTVLCGPAAPTPPREHTPTPTSTRHRRITPPRRRATAADTTAAAGLPPVRGKARALQLRGSQHGGMLGDHFPLVRLRLTTPRLELRLPSPEELGSLADLAADGVHEPDVMPFLHPWTDQPPAEVARSVLQHFWRQLGNWTSRDWSLGLTVFHQGVVVGQQGISARNFAIAREVHTGSWLGQRHQGQGIGTEMRAAVLHLAFAELGAQEAISGAFEHNASSRAVSRKLGYQPDGIKRHVVRGMAVIERRLRLTRAAWDEHRTTPVTVDNLIPCLPLLGINGQ